MKGLYQFIPPPAADYTGVSSVLFDLDGMVVVHNPGGCAKTIADIDEPRWYRKRAALFSSALRELDVVFGNDEDFIQKITDTFKYVKKKFIALVGTPVPAIIGTDLKGIAGTIQKKVDVPVLAFNTRGFDPYAAGVSAAYLKLAEQFIEPPVSKIPGSVNILGATPLDVGLERHLDMLVSLIRRAGLKVIACWTMKSSLEDIGKSACAEMNIVISHTALPLAKYMKEMYDIPYVVAVPVGRKPACNFLSLIEKPLQCNLKADYLNPNNVFSPVLPEGTRALVIGEPVLGYGVGQCLADDFGADEVIVASLFPLEDITRTGIGAGVIYLEKEEELASLINRGNFHLIVGDPCYRDLIDKHKRVIFVPLPHIALSGGDYCHMDYAYIGEEGYRYFCKSIFV